MSGTTAYPGAVDSLGSVADSVDIIADDHVNDLRRAVEAIETELGVDPRGSSSDVKARVASIETDVAAITAQMFLSAGAGVPKTTAGCASAATTELTTNKQNFKTLDFDASTEEHADFALALPSDYDGGTMTAQVFWTHAATTSDFGVVWGLEGRCFANDDAMDQAVGTAVTVTDTGGTTTDLYVTAATGAITWGGSPAAGQLIILTVFRKAADGSDTLAVDAKLIGVQLNYTRA
jgi:NADH dehydrogenase/NADH:ubiquinone oxidoreductase subunit G